MNKEDALKILKNERLSNEELSEMYWLLNKDQYKERPVTIQEFIKSDDFVHKKWPNIFPIWQETLAELFPNPFIAPYNEVLISAAAGSGKCLGKGTPILMYDGTIKNVEDIKVGDLLMGDDSTPRTVLSTTKGQERMYDVIPLRGGMTWSCNESHILSLKCSLTRPNTKKYIKDKIEDISVKDYLKQSYRYKEVMKLYRVPIDFHNNEVLEIDPYIYGLWLGDGTTRRPSLTNIDKPIIKIWCDYAKTIGLNIRVEEDKRNPKVKTYHCTNGNIGGKENIFYTFIKQSTQTGHKRILHKYKTASRENRLKLLAGIIDTDGYKQNNSATMVITTKYKDLAEDYLFLVRSLGFRGTLREKHIKLKNGQDYLSYDISFAGELSDIPIVLKRKRLEREFRDGDPLKTPFKLIDKGIGDYYGFTIDGNHRFVLGDFTVTHNTVTATISVCYDIYKLGCLKDPCTYYGLTPDTQIIMAIFSATGSTAAVNWNEITTGIEACPWIMEKLVDKRGLERKIPPIIPVEIIPGIFIQTGSKFQHSMGKAIFDGIMDEAAFGGANMKDSQKSYNELSSRIKTRFSTWGTRGNTPGQLFLISSPKEAGDFMQHRIEETRKADSKLTKIMQNIATWDADPRKDSDDKFTVFVGNENKEPCIYEPDEEPPIEEMDDLLYVPMRYYEEFKKDLLISIMNYGGVTTTSDMALFKSVTALNDIFMMSNPFKSDVIELPFAKTDKTLMDFADVDYFRNPRNPEYNRFIHIDAAFSTNTLDVYGLAGSYSVFVDDATYTGAGNSVTQEDIFSKKDRMYFTDFAVGITAPKGQEVPLYKIQDFIEWLVKIGYPIASVSADQFQSKQTLQNLQVKGFETENISVDKTRDPYLFLRQLVSNKQIVVPKNEYLKGELKHLRDDGKKVDHPVGSHKDIGDAVCGSIWNCASSNKIMNTGRVARQVLGGGVTYSPEQMQSVEMMEYERIKQNLANVFKGL